MGRAGAGRVMPDELRREGGNSDSRKDEDGNREQLHAAFSFGPNLTRT
jgi:hypothetical protein